MIAEFLEKLTQRKTEVARQAATVWQQLVITIADGKSIDADATLAALDRLAKSPDDLAKAVELLNQRREWSALVSAGAKAESEHPKIIRKIDLEIAAFTALEDAHDAAMRPMHGAERSAVQCIADGSEARRRLVETATDPIRLQAVKDADERLTTLRQKRVEFDRQLRGSEDRLRELSVQKDRDLDGHVQRLTREIEAMESERPSFHQRAEKLNAECATARTALLIPEAI